MSDLALAHIEEARRFYDENAPRIIEFVRNANAPVYIRDIVDGLSKLSTDRDQYRRLVWTMIGPKFDESGPWPLALNNKLEVTLADG